MALIGVSAAADYRISPGLRPDGYTYYQSGSDYYSKYPDEEVTKNVTFNFEQSVKGSGYFMTYRYAKVGALALKDYVHGSGSIDNEAIMFAQEAVTEDHSSGTDWTDNYVNCLSLKEDNVMVYSPMRIAIGTGYYAAKPILFDSLLKEKTWIKNYRAASSMHHEVEYAHGIDKELEVLAKENYTHIYDPTYEGVGVIQMKVNEHVDDGKIHFGVFKANGDLTAEEWVPAFQSNNPYSFGWNVWKDPSIEIDEDYFGTYDIVKNMTLETPYKLVQKSEDWLPCCSGGWADMYSSDKKGFGSSAKGIFDCSCYKVPATAQFQRVY